MGRWGEWGREVDEREEKDIGRKVDKRGEYRRKERKCGSVRK